MNSLDDKEVEETVVVKDPLYPHVTKTIKRVKTPGETVEIIDQNITSAHLSHAGHSGTEEIVSSERVEKPLIKREHPQQIFNTQKTILRLNQAVWIIMGIIEFLLGFRVTLKALGADPSSGFANLIYGLSYPLAAPFLGILQTDIGTQGSVFEWSTILGALVYLLLAYAIMHVITLAKPITPEQTAVA